MQKDPGGAQPLMKAVLPSSPNGSAPWVRQLINVADPKKVSGFFTFIFLTPYPTAQAPVPLKFGARFSWKARNPSA
jgi:hypothetical protein